MELSPEERRKIYEEEKARIESEAKGDGEGKSSLQMEPNLAALLSYLGLWITGIIFVVLETKNRYVRFHAIQSIIVFGFLAVAGALLQSIPYAGVFFGIVAGIITLVLWIVLMVKAYQGELYKVPFAGDLAEKLSGVSGDDAGSATAGPGEKPDTGDSAEHAEKDRSSGEAGIAVDAPEGTKAAAAPAVKPGSVADTLSGKGRNGRITASAFAIAWSIIWLIIFNCFNQYIAYYQPEITGNITRWVAYPLLTGEFALWLPIVNTIILMSIAGHVILIIFDNYVLREAVTIVLNVLTVIAAGYLLSIFPFDFSRIPFENAATVSTILVTVVLLVIIVAVSIATLVNFIKLIINLATRNTAY